MTYKERLESLRDNLMNKYNAAKNDDERLDCIKEMLNYGVIDRSKAFELIPSKATKAKVKEITNADNDRLPCNIYINNFERGVFEVTSLAHWIIRRELSYVGDQLAPDKVVKYAISPAYTYNVAYRNLRQLKDLYKRLNGVDFEKNFDFKSGQTIMCGINLCNGQQYIIPTLGFIAATPNNDNSIIAYMILDIENIEKQNIDIIDTAETVMITFENMVGDSFTVKFVDLVKWREAGAKQRKHRQRPLTHEEMIAKRQKEWLDKQIEDECVRTGRDRAVVEAEWRQRQEEMIAKAAEKNRAE